MKIINRKGQVEKITAKQARELTPAKKKELIFSGTEIKLLRTKNKKNGKGKKVVAVFDKITGKRLSITKYRKAVGLTKAAYSYLKTDKFEEEVRKITSPKVKDPIGAFIQDLIRTNEFERLVEISNISAYTEGYSEFYWNEVLLSRADFISKAVDLQSDLMEYEPNPYKIYLKLYYSYDVVRVYEKGYLKKFMKSIEGTEVSELEKKSFTDKLDNFILISS